MLTYSRSPFLVEENKAAEKVRDLIRACQTPVVAAQAKKPLMTGQFLADNDHPNPVTVVQFAGGITLFKSVNEIGFCALSFWRPGDLHRRRNRAPIGATLAFWFRSPPLPVFTARNGTRRADCGKFHPRSESPHYP
ncbi:hypothetical protein [Superficieibacter sp. HKU1]|uniref:hypothetical protein n=1 Tax=Superficieibacter sp. HKU1 TaxID=3031919 RepID=UPI0023E27828|nr:hypothetical protein [Superficieibacter sp. HKU1]WES68479.1 hypothetical protein P0H77_00255 [Superficieibacter sp. HKU1]